MKKRAVEKPTAQVLSVKRRATGSVQQTSQPAWFYYFKDGQEAFQAGDFQKAADLFTRALCDEPTHATLLDCRAATYEKLNRLEDAFLDAKTMIQKQPTNAKGYLRGAKLLVDHPPLADMFKVTALAVCRKGCKRVPPTDPRYKQLETRKQTLERHAAMRKNTRDPITLFPTEVLAQIFNYLPFHRKLACMLVSKNWRAFLVAWPAMWANLDLITGATRRNANLKTLQRYLLHTNGQHVRKVSFTGNADIFSLLRQHNCTKLTQINLLDSTLSPDQWTDSFPAIGSHLTHLQLNSLFCSENYCDVVSRVLDACPQLTHLFYTFSMQSPRREDETIRGAPHALQQLYLTVCDGHCHLPPSALESLAARCPDLTHLYTSFLDHHLLLSLFPKLRVLDLHLKQDVLARDDWFNTKIMAAPTTGLEELGTTQAASEENMLRFVDQDLMPHIASLHTLRLELVAVGRPTRLDMMPPSSILHTLELRTVGHDEQSLLHLISLYPRLTNVKFTHMSEVNDNVAHALAELPNLTHLDLSMTSITGAGLRPFVEKRAATLVALIANDCRLISPDAVQFVRDRLGTRFTCTLTDTRRRRR
ncbi:hypothetical protein BC940DRAFT_300181 [Gongronella butleri]|nr:hypothetical protein BC940DRAFT_300181 [Gongronella butleri]